MDGRMDKPVLIVPSMCDDMARLSYPGTFSLFMDAAAEHAESIGVGMKPMLEKGLFWLTVKTKVRFYDRPNMMESVTVSTWPGIPEKIRCERYYTLTAGARLLAEGKTEWAIMETTSGKLKSVSHVYPEALQLTDDTVCNGSFVRISEDFSNSSELGSYVVRSSDIDMGGHMNNAQYVRAIFDTFSCRKLREMTIGEVEVAFRTPCFEGDVLSIRCRHTDAGTEMGLIRTDGRAAVVARIA